VKQYTTCRGWIGKTRPPWPCSRLPPPSDARKEWAGLEEKGGAKVPIVFEADAGEPCVVVLVQTHMRSSIRVQTHFLTNTASNRSPRTPCNQQCQ
jgi:hypothetical protein